MCDARDWITLLRPHGRLLITTGSWSTFLFDLLLVYFHPSDGFNLTKKNKDVSHPGDTTCKVRRRRGEARAARVDYKSGGQTRTVKPNEEAEEKLVDNPISHPQLE